MVFSMLNDQRIPDNVYCLFLNDRKTNNLILHVKRGEYQIMFIVCFSDRLTSENTR